MIAVHCALCGTELDEPGAIALAPPDFPFRMVDKFHICKLCWYKTFRPLIMRHR